MPSAALVARAGIVVAGVEGVVIVDVDHVVDAVEVRHEFAGCSGPSAVQEHRGAAVVDDVRDLVRREPGGDRCVAVAGVVACPDEDGELGPVLDAERNRVAGAQPEIVEHVGGGDRSPAQLGPRGGLARGGHDQRRRVGTAVRRGGRGVPCPIGAQPAVAEAIRSIAISRCAICSAAVRPCGARRRQSTPAAA